MSYFTLIFGELVPKRVAMRKAEPLALAMSSMISSIAALFAPIVSLLTVSTNGVLRLLGIDPDAEDDEVSEESIRIMVDTGSEKGAIDREEQVFIQNVFEFDDPDRGRDRHPPHGRHLPLAEDDMDQWKETIYRSRHNYYPVCGENGGRCGRRAQCGRLFPAGGQEPRKRHAARAQAGILRAGDRQGGRSVPQHAPEPRAHRNRAG